MNRRSFLRVLGLGTAAVVAAPLLSTPKVLVQSVAPLFIPSQNLDMGVPHRILTATEMPTAPAVQTLMQYSYETVQYRMAQSVPVMLLQDNYISEWGGRLKAGSTLLVDQTTADRWLSHRIAVHPDATASQVAQVIPGRDFDQGRFDTSQQRWYHY